MKAVFFMSPVFIGLYIIVNEGLLEYTIKTLTIFPVPVAIDLNIVSEIKGIRLKPFINTGITVNVTGK